MKCVTAIRTLKYLIVQDCDRAIEDEDNDEESIQNLVNEERKYWTGKIHQFLETLFLA